MSKMIVSASLLAADLINVKEEVDRVLQAGVDWLHVDVMDGHFVPNLTFGLPLICALRKVYPKLFLDVHIMVSNPDAVALEYAKAGASLVTFHAEAAIHSHRIIQQLKESGSKAGIAINPGTSIAQLDSLLDEIDLVLVMSVNPGFGGQSFISSSLQKISLLKKQLNLLSEENRPIIQVDGGINDSNIMALKQAGTSCVVAGSYLFGSKNLKKAVLSLKV